MHQRIGVLGGTFNPVHYGHLAAAEEVREKLELDLVLFIPSFLPPHKYEKDIPAPAQRLKMVDLAVAGNTHFAVSDIELNRGGKSYTVDTIEELRAVYPEAGLFFLTGLDSFLEIRTWHRWQHLLSLCSFVVLSRPGYRFSDLRKIDFLERAETDFSGLDNGEIRQATFKSGASNLYFEAVSRHDISSSEIRSRRGEGRSIKYLLPEPVEHYIITNKLYV